MAENFRRSWRKVAVSQSKPPLEPENKRQRSGNEKKIVEVLVKKGPRANGFNQPAIDGVEQAGRETQRVDPVTEGLHKRAVITSPAPIARSTFRQNTVMKEK